MWRRDARAAGSPSGGAPADGGSGFHARAARCFWHAPGLMKERRPAPAAAPDPYGSDAAAAGQRVPPGLAARSAALQILVRVQQHGGFADVLLGRRMGAFGAADRRLLTQLVLGTLAWQGRLDFELAHHSARPLQKLAPQLLALLRMGLFQLRMLTRIPPHAAVDTAVTLAREAGYGHAAGYVN